MQKVEAPPIDVVPAFLVFAVATGDHQTLIEVYWDAGADRVQRVLAY
jgi:hypothetical protein